MYSVFLPLFTVLHFFFFIALPIVVSLSFFPSFLPSFLPALPLPLPFFQWDKGDNRTEDTTAVQQAVDECATVVFSGGRRYLLRPVNLSHSGLHLSFEANATVVAWGDLATWPTGNEAVFYATGHALLSNLTITGPASGTYPTVDGQGWRWWPYGKTRPRPHLLSVPWAQTLLISRMRFKDSPSFHLMVRGDRLTLTDNRVEV